MDHNENYVYQSDVIWSILTEGFTLPVDNQVVFARNMGRFLQRGELKEITLYLNGKGYKAQIRNVNFDKKFNRKQDILQIRYPKNGEFAKALHTIFFKSYGFIINARMSRPDNDRSMIRLPEDKREYFAIYTTEYEDSYIIETIEDSEIALLKDTVKGKSELIIESSFNYDIEDNTASIIDNERIVKVRKLNRKIADNLKLLYDYRCQICGHRIGENYGTNTVEAHHIDYFIRSLNNNANNQLIVCPNHHSIIHDANPQFDRSNLAYLYSNGYTEGLIINQHLHQA